MSRIQLSSSLYAGMLLCPVLLAATPNFAQQVVRSVEPPPSIISLASTPKPQGAMLARNATDSRFENAPANYHVFAAATVGEDAGVEVLTLNFAAETKLIRIQSKNKDFVIEPGGSCVEGNSYAKGGSCTLTVRFNPQGPGHRLGFVTVANTADATPMSFGLTGNGYAPVVTFTPSVITTVPASVSSGTGTISGATNLAIDGGDILYIADTGNNKLKEMDSSGKINPTALTPISTPVSLAADSFGIVYTANTHGSTYYFTIFYPWGSQTAYGYAYTSATCTVSAPCAFSAVGMNYPANMSIDNYNNLYFEEGTTGAAEMPVENVSGGSGTLNLWHLSDQFSYSSGSPGSFAVDANGNLYTEYNFSTFTCYLLEEPLYDAEYSPTAVRVAGGVNCGYSGDGGQGRAAEISSTIGQIAFDIAGNLYFADAGNQRVRRIDASTGIISTIAGNGTAGYAGDGGAAIYANLSSPTGVAVDSQGQVYILSNAPTAGPTQVLRKVGVTGRIGWVPQLKGTTSGANIVTVSNTGNDTLTLSSAAFFNGANPSEFAIDPNTTTCVLSASATLAAGKSCKIGIVFTPAAAGYRAANLVLLD
ncbi:MAG TPA: choice-of-anchor D domain-containing protein, partial [Terracidiphilus sp.]|nr:choice-of-anchor D domain-containing protein [Terracidiphilus sp.]